MKLRERLPLLRLALLPLWAGVILWFSSDSQSPGKSKGLLLQTLAQWIPGFTDNIDLFNLLARKCAHMAEYGLLTALCVGGFLKVQPITRALWFRTLGIVLIAASIDEFYQTYVPGREGKPYDVLVDMMGALAVLSAIAAARKNK